MNDFYVYKHTTPNNKVYIGITKQLPHKRWGKNGNGYKVHNKHFYNAILKYGWDNIKHEILFTNLSKEEACEKEIELINFYKSNLPQYGYNKSTGGEMSASGCKRSKETRLKISIARKGVPMKEETKHLLSESRKGKKSVWYGKHHTDETRRKISEWNRQHRVSKVVDNSKKEYIRSEETRRKIADATKIPILQFSLNDEFICEYESILSASQNTNVAKQNICKCCKGNRQTAGGYKWKYKIYGSAHEKKDGD